VLCLNILNKIATTKYLYTQLYLHDADVLLIICVSDVVIQNLPCTFLMTDKRAFQLAF